MFRGLMGEREQIDLLKVSFDPQNGDHQAELKARIASFNIAVSALIKTDVMIVVPVSASLLLWLSGVCPLMIELVLLAACAAMLWAADKMSQRASQYKDCQEKLGVLVGIYKKCIVDHGYQITANVTMLALLQAIAPYVETSQLWAVRSNNPAVYPDEFKKILSTAPHRVPFDESKTDTANTLFTAAANLVGLSSGVAVASPVVMQQYTGGVLTLFRRVAADVKQTVYGLDEGRMTAINKR